MSSATITPPQAKEADTPTRILDVAEQLVQTRGYNDFSYAHIAGELGISKPSLHYHFPTKASLGVAMIRRYGTRFFDDLALIDQQEPDGARKLRRYVDLYRDAVAANRMCLCGILAAEFHTLPDDMRCAVLDFFDRNEAWLTQVLAESAHAPNSEDRRRTARSIIDTLEGSVMLARTYDDLTRFDDAATRLMTTLESG